MNGPELMRAAVDEEIKRTTEELSYASPDAFRHQMEIYRATLQGRGEDPSSLTNPELISRMAYLNAESTELN